MLQDAVYPPGKVREGTRLMTVLRAEQSLTVEEVGYCVHDDQEPS